MVVSGTLVASHFGGERMEIKKQMPAVDNQGR